MHQTKPPHSNPHNQLITQSISAYESQKHQLIQLGLNDPFQTYYYPSSIDDPAEIARLEEQVKGKILHLENMAALEEIRGRLEAELYVANQQIQVQLIQLESVEAVIRSVEAQIQSARIKKQLRNINGQRSQYKINTSVQTESVRKLKDVAIDCQIDAYNRQRKLANTKMKNHISATYCINVLPIRIDNIAQATVSNNIPKPQKQQHNPKPQKSQPPQPPQQKPPAQPKTITHPSHQHPLPTNTSNISQTYSHIQTEIRYLQHIKEQFKTNPANKIYRKRYEEQKRRVKFMMEMFWKSVGDVEAGGSDLPLLQL